MTLIPGGRTRGRTTAAGRPGPGEIAGRPRQGRISDQEATALRRLAPLATTVVLVVWISAIGFRAHWWTTGRLDEGWDATTHGWVSAPLQAVAQAFAVAGTGVPALLEIALLALLVHRRHGTYWAAATMVICALSSAEVASMKAVAQRLRPDSAFGWQTSFPSGHTTLAALLMTLAPLLLLRGRWRLLALPYPLLMAWSRTQLHAHWISDVLAGALLGAATAVLLVLAAETVATRLSKRCAEAGSRPVGWWSFGRPSFALLNVRGSSCDGQ